MKKAFHRHCKTHPLEVSNNSLLQKVREFSDTSLYIYTEYMDASQIYEFMDAMLLSDIIHITLHTWYNCVILWNRKESCMFWQHCRLWNQHESVRWEHRAAGDSQSVFLSVLWSWVMNKSKGEFPSLLCVRVEQVKACVPSLVNAIRPRRLSPIHVCLLSSATPRTWKTLWMASLWSSDGSVSSGALTRWPAQKHCSIQYSESLSEACCVHLPVPEWREIQKPALECPRETESPSDGDGAIKQEISRRE